MLQKDYSFLFAGCSFWAAHRGTVVTINLLISFKNDIKKYSRIIVTINMLNSFRNVLKRCIVHVDSVIQGSFINFFFFIVFFF